MNKTQFRSHKLFALVLLILLVLTSAVATRAQGGRSTIKGVVKDQQGHVVPGATLNLTSLDKNFARTQTTTADGVYVFSAIPPGAYKVEVEAAGFKKYLLGRVEALVETPLNLDITLEVGSISELVTVTSANEPALNSTDATIGNAFENQRIKDCR
jgi:hypothetical protein